MKKFLLIIFLFCCFSTFSQNLKFKSIKFGLSKSDFDQTYSNRDIGYFESVSYQIGYSNQYSINKNLDIIFGLEIQSYKSKSNTSDIYGNYAGDFKTYLRNLDNPVKICYLISRNSSINFGGFTSLIIIGSNNFENDEGGTFDYNYGKNKFRYGIIIEYSLKITSNIKLDIFQKIRVNKNNSYYSASSGFDETTTEYMSPSTNNYGININYIF